eukprot:1115791-Prymnesium_polylepis.2
MVRPCGAKLPKKAVPLASRTLPPRTSSAPALSVARLPAKMVPATKALPPVTTIAPPTPELSGARLRRSSQFSIVRCPPLSAIGVSSSSKTVSTTVTSPPSTLRM